MNRRASRGAGPKSGGRRSRHAVLTADSCQLARISDIDSVIHLSTKCLLPVRVAIYNSFKPFERVSAIDAAQAPTSTTESHVAHVDAL